MFFFLKKPKNQKGNARYIYLRLTVDGVSKDVATKRQWDALRWNPTAGRAIGLKEDAKALNSYLDVMCGKVYQAKKMLMDADKAVTVENLKNILTGQSEEKRMILSAFKHHNEQMKVLVGQEFAASTLMRYKTAHDHTAAFIKWKYQLDDLQVRDLDYEFVSQFAFWLKSVRKCGHNATMKYLGNFKKIVLECMKKGWLLKDPFSGFKTNRKEVIRVALTKEELKSIENKEFETERLNHVRDIFLFSCYTGLAYVDVYQLMRSNIVTGVDGDKWIVAARQKTESAIRIPLLPAALKIMAKYEDDPKCVSKGRLLPVLTNQKMNSYLKEIADGCRINKNLTFHIARHTFATTVTLNNGVPIETVSKMLGHKSLKQTQHYAKIVDLKISADMELLKAKLG